MVCLAVKDNNQFKLNKLTKLVIVLLKLVLNVLNGLLMVLFIPKAAKFAVLIPGPGMLVNVRNAPRVVIPPPSETPPVSPCKPLCAILLRKPSVYPLSPVKANVGRLCERLKNAMKCGLEQRCAGNFLAIFAGTVLGEKPNFTGGFFER